MGFSPGELTKADADKLSRMERLVDQLSRMTATPPLSINKSGYNPILSLGQVYIPLLAEVVSVSGTTYTVKRKTRDSTNAVVDLTPVELVQNVVTPDGSVLAVGDYVNIQAIPDWPLPVQFWWGTLLPASSGGSSNCSQFTGTIRSGSCMTLSIYRAVGACGCIDTDQTSNMTWDGSAMVGDTFIYGCSPGVVTTLCPDGAPNKFKIVVAGFTGGSVNFNQTYTVTHSTGEVWTQVLNGVTATFTALAAGDWSFTLDDGTATVVYGAVSPSASCCEDIPLELDDGDGTSDPPATLTALVATACGLGTPYTPYLDLCEDTCLGEVPRLRLVPAAGSGAATITLTQSGCGAVFGDFSTSSPLLCMDDADTDCADNSVTFRVECSVEGDCSPFVDYDTEGCCGVVQIPRQICITLESDDCPEFTDDLDTVTAPHSFVVTYDPDGLGPGLAAWMGEWSSLYVVSAVIQRATSDPEDCRYRWSVGFARTGVLFPSDAGECDFTATMDYETDCSVFELAFPLAGTFAGSDSATCQDWICTEGDTFTLTMANASGGCSTGNATFNCLENGTCIDPGDGSGEFDTEAECLADCDVGGVPSTCCPDADGESATLTITGGADAGSYGGTWSVTEVSPGNWIVQAVFALGGSLEYVALCTSYTNAYTGPGQFALTRVTSGVLTGSGAASSQACVAGIPALTFAPSIGPSGTSSIVVS